MPYLRKVGQILTILILHYGIFSCQSDKTESPGTGTDTTLTLTDSISVDSSKIMSLEAQYQAFLDSVYQRDAKSVYEILLKGNRRFVADSAFVNGTPGQVPDSLSRRKPFFLLTDVDLQQSPDKIFDLKKSMVMQLSAPACLLDPKHVAVMEYAVVYGGTKVILVLANSNSKMIGAACDNVKTGNFGLITTELNKAIGMAQEFADRSSANKDYVNNIAQNQAILSLGQIASRSPRLKALSDSGKIVLKSAYFDAATGVVTILEPKVVNTLTK